MVQVEVNPAYKVNGGSRLLEILPWLREVKDISVIENDEVPPLSIVVDKRVVAVVDPFDEPGMNSPCDEGSTLQRVKDLRPLVIFKYQWRRGVDYPKGTIS